jgi:hypothetical protein
MIIGAEYWMLRAGQPQGVPLLYTGVEEVEGCF